jgi:hypothetical protein
MVANAIVPLNVESAVQSVEHLALIVRHLRSNLLVEGQDYGTIPGTGDKPTLLLPGMEKLMRALNAVPQYTERRIMVDYDKPLFHYEYECRLVDADTGVLIPGAVGIGLCTSMESAFRWRDAKRQCPRCGQPTINRSKYPPRNNPNAEPGWYCHAKAGGCGAEFAANDTVITAQTIGRMENPDIFDQINAICKRAQKRSLGSAVKGAANVSQFFTVDVEDLPSINIHRPPVDDAIDADYEDVSNSEAKSPPAKTTPPASRLGQKHNPPVGREDQPPQDAPPRWTVETLKLRVGELFQNDHNYYHAVKNYSNVEHDEFMLPSDLTLDEAVARVRFYRSRTGKADMHIFEDEKVRERFVGACAGIIENDSAIREALDAVADYPVGSLTAWKGDKGTAWAAVLAAAGLYIARQAVPEGATPETAALVTLICEHVSEVEQDETTAGESIPA